MEMRFAIGSPTTLESGTWRWSRNNQVAAGSIAARSVTFLGGQDGPPSIGGTTNCATPAAWRVSRRHSGYCAAANVGRRGPHKLAKLSNSSAFRSEAIHQFIPARVQCSML